MDHRQTENFYIVTAPGLEDVCAAELHTLGIQPQEVDSGGIVFAGKLRELYLANLHLRTASRILVRFAELQSRAFPELYRKTIKLPWGRFIKPDQAVAFRITCRQSRLNHTTRIAETLESATNQALGRTTNPKAENPQLIMVRIVGDQVTFSIDSSGDLLHRRGYRKSVTKAPLRETLAAGVLLLLGWNGEEALADPMCGSGSFPLEGAQIACKQAPGRNRHYAFMGWPGYRQGLWKLICDEARRNETESNVEIIGMDEDHRAVQAAKANCLQSGNSDRVTFTELALSSQVPKSGNGLVICNPPYGKRLPLGENPEIIYQDLGKQLKRVFPGWRKALICPDAKLVKATGLPFKKIKTLDNGGLKVHLFVFKP